MKYTASDARYKNMKYNKCGESGLKLPAVSLGLWHNFGANDCFETMREMCFQNIRCLVRTPKDFDPAKKYPVLLLIDKDLQILYTAPTTFPIRLNTINIKAPFINPLFFIKILCEKRLQLYKCLTKRD